MISKLNAALQAASFVRRALKTISTYVDDFAELWAMFLDISKHVFQADFGLERITFTEPVNVSSLSLFKRVWGYFVGSPEPPSWKERIVAENEQILTGEQDVMLGRREKIALKMPEISGGRLSVADKTFQNQLDSWKGCQSVLCGCCQLWQIKSQLATSASLEQPLDEGLQGNLISPQIVQ